MPAAIKRVMAEHARAAEIAASKRLVYDDTDDIMDLIDAAAPFIDEKYEGGQYSGGRPSLKLAIQFFILGYGSNGQWAGIGYVNRMLDRARERWLAGYYANPFEKEPVLRR